MDGLEASGKTVEEATQHALEELGVEREEVRITVIKEGKHGILGLGSEDAMVMVEPLKSAEVDVLVEQAKKVLEELLNKMDVAASVVYQSEPFLVTGKSDRQPIIFDIRGDDLGILIGRQGQTLACLQHIVRLIMAHQTKTVVPIVVDVEGYKQRRYKALQALAWRMADEVKSSGMPFTLEPMSAYERRIIHISLADNPDVVTESIDDGDLRKVVIQPRE